MHFHTWTPLPQYEGFLYTDHANSVNNYKQPIVEQVAQISYSIKPDESHALSHHIYTFTWIKTVIKVSLGHVSALSKLSIVTEGLKSAAPVNSMDNSQRHSMHFHTKTRPTFICRDALIQRI